MAEHDSITRARLLDTAARLFAAQGFKRVTVRDICHEAGANVAAVNYHFGDKLGLYSEVVGIAIQTMRETTDLARGAAAGASAEDRLRIYVHIFLERVVGAQAQDGWIHQIMVREMADPTPALDLVAERVIRPRLEYVASIVGEILDLAPEHDVVKRCVLSVQAQMHAAMPNYLARHLLPELHDAARLSELAEHITQFSIAGLRDVARRLRSEARVPQSAHERA